MTIRKSQGATGSRAAEVLRNEYAPPELDRMAAVRLDIPGPRIAHSASRIANPLGLRAHLADGILCGYYWIGGIVGEGRRAENRSRRRKAKTREDERSKEDRVEEAHTCGVAQTGLPGAKRNNPHATRS